MKVIKASPQGYCNGVKCAIDIAKNAACNAKLKKPIYILGMLIHNKRVTSALKNHGIITINNGKTRLEMLDEIENGTVIITAHGASDTVYAKAKKKGLMVVDATCPIVKRIHNNVKTYLEKGYKIIYIGNKNHPEAKGVLGLNKDIICVQKLDDLNLLDKKATYYVTNQTTLSIFDIEVFYEKIKTEFKNYIIDNKICLATTKRQKALLELKAPLLVVVGDKSSSNTAKLEKIGLESLNYQRVIKVEDLNDLNGIDLKEYDEAVVTSGASTPYVITNEIVKYLENYDAKKPAISKIDDASLL